MVNKFFLGIKAWQLFILFFSLFVFAGILWSTNLPLRLKKFIFPVISLAGVYWAYILGVNLHIKNQKNDKIKFVLFILSLLITYFVMSFPQYIFKDSSPRILVMILINIFPFYCIYYLSKYLVSVEIEKDASIYEYGGTFILFWMLPLGIFWLQPRVRKIFYENESGA